MTSGSGSQTRARRPTPAHSLVCTVHEPWPACLRRFLSGSIQKSAEPCLGGSDAGARAGGWAGLARRAEVGWHARLEKHLASLRCKDRAVSCAVPDDLRLFRSVEGAPPAWRKPKGKQ